MSLRESGAGSERKRISVNEEHNVRRGERILKSHEISSSDCKEEKESDSNRLPGSPFSWYAIHASLTLGCQPLELESVILSLVRKERVEKRCFSSSNYDFQPSSPIILGLSLTIGTAFLLVLTQATR